MTDQREGIVIVANRGPNDFVWEDGAWVTRTATGGLVSMLTPLARRASVAWFCCVSEPPDAQQARQGLFTTASDQTDPSMHIVPVPLPAEIYHAYYGQISNEVLWMLQHHVIGSGGFEYLDYARHQAWKHYIDANARLASAITRSGGTPRAFLIQDYHLYPLPGMLRATYPDTPILHFTAHPVSRPAGAASDSRGVAQGRARRHARRGRRRPADPHGRALVPVVLRRAHGRDGGYRLRQRTRR